jgi:hypothetical protein
MVMIKKIKSKIEYIRLFGFPNYGFWYDTYWSIHDFLFPKQKWLTQKVIGKSWRDKPEMMADILFECIIHFVEVEQGTKHEWKYDDEYSSYDREDKRQEILKIYRYAKTIRTRLEHKCFEADMKFYRFYEHLYNQYETEYCKKIIDLKSYLWT